MAESGAWLFRGTVEGFYGPPWSHEQRLAHLAFSAEVGFTSYVYAPKDDPFHRLRWREPYPSPELARIGELARTGAQRGVRYVHALHPALDMRFADDSEHAALAAKAGQLLSAGVRSFALLFDDVPYELTDPHDVTRWGAGARACGLAHGHTVRRFAEGVLAAHRITGPLLVCPTDYAGTGESPYRSGFAETAPDDVVVAWTGSDVIVGTVTRPDIELAAASYRRPVVLWDNFPVNDFDQFRLFLGPLTGRPADVAGIGLTGILANPMVQATASRLALATVADWAGDPSGYDPAVAAASALVRVAGPGARQLAPLVRACSAWPPGADQDPELSRAAGAALAGDDAAAGVLTTRLRALAEGCATAREPARLVAELRPWLDAGGLVAAAGLAALDLLRAGAHGPDGAQTAVLRARVQVALDRAEHRPENVLRGVIPPFVRAVLDRTDRQRARAQGSAST